MQDIFDQNGVQIEDPKDIRIAVDLDFEETMEKDPVERLNALIRAYRALPDSNLCHEHMKRNKGVVRRAPSLNICKRGCMRTDPSPGWHPILPAD